MSANTKKLTGKVAVVTGASKGIGASIAKHLAAEGASVVVNYASSKAGADKVVAEITSAGGQAVAVQGDVAKKPDVDRLFEPSELHVEKAAGPTGPVFHRYYEFIHFLEHNLDEGQWNRFLSAAGAKPASEEHIIDCFLENRLADNIRFMVDAKTGEKA